MKIALVCFNLSWQAGGVRLLYEEAHALKRLGHSVVFYTPEFDDRVYPQLYPGIDIRVIRPETPIAWQYGSANLFARISQKIRERQKAVRVARQIAEAMDLDFDIVNLHDFAYKVARFYRARNASAPIVWYMADPPYMYLPKANILYDLASRVFNWYVDRAERRYFQYINAAAVLVRRNKAWVERRGIPAHITWTGIDFNSFLAPPREILAGAPIVLMSVGALNKYRRFEDAIRALQVLRGRGHDAKLVIVCKNIWGQDEYARELEHLITECGLSGDVRLLLDGASEVELKRLYATSHFFILPIHLPPPRNGFGWQMVMFEALAAGLPTVVCRTNDVTEAVTDGTTALFVDPANPHQIATKVEGLIQNPKAYASIASAGQVFVRDNMSWEKFARGIINAGVRRPDGGFWQGAHNGKS